MISTPNILIAFVFGFLAMDVMAQAGNGLVIDTEGYFYFFSACPKSAGTGCLVQVDATGKVTSSLEARKPDSKFFLARNPARDMYAAERYQSGQGPRFQLWKMAGGWVRYFSPTLRKEIFHAQALAINARNEVYFAVDTEIFKQNRYGQNLPVGDKGLPGTVHAAFSTKDGTLFTLKGNKLWKITETGKTQELVNLKALLNAEPKDENERGNKNTFAMTVDEAGQIYLSSNQGFVIKVTPGGQAQVWYTSEKGWVPAGIDTDREGIYVLEYKLEKNDAAGVKSVATSRVTKISAGGTKAILFERRSQS